MAPAIFIFLIVVRMKPLIQVNLDENYKTNLDELKDKLRKNIKAAFSIYKYFL